MSLSLFSRLAAIAFFLGVLGCPNDEPATPAPKNGPNDATEKPDLEREDAGAPSRPKDAGTQPSFADSGTQPTADDAGQAPPVQDGGTPPVNDSGAHYSVRDAGAPWVWDSGGLPAHGNDAGRLDDAPLTTAQIYEGLKAYSCGSCHAHNYFSSLSTFESTVVNNAAWVVPGASSESEFYLLLQGQANGAYAGMPLYQSAYYADLPDAPFSMAEIASWIDDSLLASPQPDGGLALGDAGHAEPTADAGSGNGDDGATISCSEDLDVGVTPMRRLTNREYRQVIEDITGVVVEEESKLSEDIVVEGFANHLNSSSPSLAHLDGFLRESEFVSAQLPQFKSSYTGCAPDAADLDACAENFIVDFGFQCFRRPLSAAEVDLFRQLYQAGAQEGGADEGLKWVTEALLQSPQFLYRIETPPAVPEGVVTVNGYEMASRLSFLIWGSVPDDLLYTAAANGLLGTPAEIEAEVRRMVADPKARRNIGNFFSQWLELEPETPHRDATLFPDFNDALYADMLTETLEFIAFVYWDEGFTFDQLFTAPFTVANQTITEHYGLQGGEPETWQKIDLDPERYSGLLTQPSFLTHWAHSNQTSPVLRGLYVRERLMCEKLPAPPDLVDISLPEPAENIGTRERLARHQEEAACASCHQLIDPIGFGFENFDPTGRWRDAEGAGLSISAAGSIVGLDVSEPDFHGVVEMSDLLQQSNQVQDCFVENWARFSLGRTLTERDRCGVRQIQAHFKQSGTNLQELFVALALQPSFRLYRSPDVSDEPEDALDAGPPPELDTQHVYEALSPSCLTCHPNYFATYGNFVFNLLADPALVTPGNAAASELYHRLVGSPNHNAMPPGTPYVDLPDALLTSADLFHWFEGLDVAQDETGPSTPFHDSPAEDCGGGSDCPAAPEALNHDEWHPRLTESPWVSWAIPENTAYAYFEISFENTATTPSTFSEYVLDGDVTSFQAVDLWLGDTDFVVVHLRGVDDAGVASAMTQSSGWTVDIRNPEPVWVDDTRIPVTGELRWEGSAADEGSGFSHYEYAVGSAQGEDDIVPWTHVADANQASIATEDLAFGHWLFASVRAVDVAGNKTERSGTGFTVCPDNYIFVPASETPGIATLPFCVSAFEMKVQGDDEGENACECVTWANNNQYCKQTSCTGSVAEARPSGTPWTWVMHASADLACSEPDVTYRAIMNDEWQTIARNIEATPENWSGNAVGSGYVNQGNSDATPGVPLPVADVNNPCDGTENPACEDKTHSDYAQKRTHTLSNGAVIWDFAGNVAERVGNSPGLAVESYSLWQSFTGDVFNTVTNHETHRLKYGPAGPYDESHKIGRFYLGTQELSRGGSHSAAGTSGIFTGHHKGWNPSFTTGFRCTYAP